jgi:Flp pilus assembly protein TadD
LDQLIQLWRAAHKAQPDDLQITRGLVQSLIVKKDYDSGLTVIQDALLRQPNQPLLYTLRAELELKKGTAKAAVSSLQRVAALKPDDAAAKRDLAVAQDAALDLPGAIVSIGEARKLDPTNVQIAAEEVRLLGKRSPEDGLAAARKTAAELPDRADAQALEGDYLRQAKRPADAMAAYERAFQSHPSLLLADRVANAAARAGKPAEGAKVLADWADAHPGDVGAKLLLAASNLQQKKYAEAKPLYETVLKAQPDNILALNDLAWLYQRDGDARALDLAKRAYAQAPQTPAFADTLGWIMVQKGDVPNGLRFLQQARLGMPADLGVQYHVAFALDRAGNKAEAVDTLKKALAAGKDFDEKKDAESLLATLSKT